MRFWWSKKEVDRDYDADFEKLHDLIRDIQLKLDDLELDTHKMYEIAHKKIQSNYESLERMIEANKRETIRGFGESSENSKRDVNSVKSDVSGVAYRVLMLEKENNKKSTKKKITKKKVKAKK